MKKSNFRALGVILSAFIFSGMIAPSQAGAATNILLNPGFESGNTAWMQESGSYNLIVNNSELPGGVTAHGGSWLTWFSGYNNANDVLYQQVTISSSAIQAYVQFWYFIATGETSGENDLLSLEIRSASNVLLKTLKTYSNLDQTSGWVQSEQFGVSEFKGQTIRLRFQAISDATINTNFFVDDVALVVTQGAIGPVADFDGNGSTDVAGLHHPSDQFFTFTSGNLGQYGWGAADCYPLVWDYNGDGITEVSIYHIPTNQWFVRGYPNDNMGQFGWGQEDCIPVPGDYNGDGIMERSFYHTPSNTFFVEEQGGGVTQIQFGWNGADCIPVPGDYDGDGRTDLMIYHIPSNQWLMYGVGNQGQYGWNGQECIPVPGDYDGDGSTEIAVYHYPTNQWFVKGYPGDNLGQYGWGGAESFPIPGDYNGDGITERGFYRQSENWWFIENQPDFVWGWGGQDFMPITSQVNVFNWFRFVLGRFQ